LPSKRYIINVQQLLVNAQTRKTRQNIIQELESTIAKLNSNPILEIRTKLADMKQGGAFFDTMRSSNINNIEQILNRLSVKDRFNMHESVLNGLKVNGLELSGEKPPLDQTNNLKAK
jgi:ABC-type transporter Mla maintaining outer membrane lipid asymmetry ATPase subunit MlaF